MRQRPSKLPFVIAGKRLDPGADGRLIELRASGARLFLPTLTPGVVERALDRSVPSVADLSLDEIVVFLHNVGQNWKSEEYSRRRIYIQQLVDLLGYSQRMAEREANWIAFSLSAHTHIYDTVATELGHRHILDRWIPTEEVDVRAWPKGRIFHLLPGNVPLAGVTSVLRALVTKNHCVVKASSDDPITPVQLALSFSDVDPEHPVTRAMTVVHWKGGDADPTQKQLLQGCDALVAWGGNDAIRWAAAHAPPGIEVLNFGPRRSLALIGAGANVREAARGLAHDSSIYDQRACFSVQQAFVEAGLVPQLLAELEQACDLFTRILPRGKLDFDDRAAFGLAQLDAIALGHDVRGGGASGWSVICCAPEDVELHPLGRTLFIHAVDKLEDALAYVDGEVQTVAVQPWSRMADLRDACARAGVSRVVELGLTNVFRLGGTHDGMRPLQRLVRFVSAEHSSRHMVKGMSVRLDQTKFLEENRFVEFIP